jgi:nitroimidazol reductase NimA-like FMN-containing flavoprotein (pyridoxamine 5'-phosphate oxidase superfamily)
MVLSAITEDSARPQQLSGDACRAALARSCFGHLAFTRHSHVEAVPIRFAFVEGWLYFRANSGLRAAIAHNPWAVVSVAEALDPTMVDSFVASGGCYGTEQTGSAAEDAVALRGIMRLRGPQPADHVRTSTAERTGIVFRMHVDQLRGYRMSVPPADHLSDSTEVRQGRSPVSRLP